MKNELIKDSEAKKALERLKSGNERYLSTDGFNGDISKMVREETCKNGQKPFALVITCSDSRVIPEAIFSCGIGDIFVIRVAGNVVGETELASADYCVEHLGVKLAVVLGHTRCGAVGAAIEGHVHGIVGAVTKEIKRAIGAETDPIVASGLNAIVQAEKLRKQFPTLSVIESVYDIESGKVIWLSSDDE
ncbi:MAG: carbonic anhydrase [Clostridia bacterium]|nr:carbonic anhydrase [Clostridia bacterium]